MRKAFWIGLIATAAVAGGGLALGWHRLSTSRAEADPETVATAETSSAPLVQQNGDQITVTVNEVQLEQLVTEAVRNRPEVATIFGSVDTLDTRLSDDRIETGGMVNLSELSLEALPTEARAGVEQLTNRVPLLANRDVYIGISSRPQVENGEVRLSSDTKLKIGQLTLPLSEVAAQLGLSAGEIEERLNQLIRSQGISLDDIAIANDQLIITGTSQ